MVEYDKINRILRMRVLESGLSPEQIRDRLALARRLLEQPRLFTGDSHSHERGAVPSPISSEA
jgi:hypothetical protein